MQDARSQDFPTYCAQCREKEGRPQAADNLSARNNPGQDVYVSGENDAAAKVGEMIVDKLVRQNAIQREGEPVDEVNEGGVCALGPSVRLALVRWSRLRNEAEQTPARRAGPRVAKRNELVTKALVDS